MVVKAAQARTLGRGARLVGDDKETFEVTDDTRIRAALPTFNKVLEDGGSVVLMSHLGRPKLGAEDKFSLRHIVSTLSSLLNREVQFCDDCIGEKADEKLKEYAGE